MGYARGDKGMIIRQKDQTFSFPLKEGDILSLRLVVARLGAHPDGDTCQYHTIASEDVTLELEKGDLGFEKVGKA